MQSHFRSPPWPVTARNIRSRCLPRSRPFRGRRAGRRCTRTSRGSSPEDDKRFWFYNSMHFPEPMPAFDTITAEIPYTRDRREHDARLRLPDRARHRLPHHQRPRLHHRERGHRPGGDRAAPEVFQERAPATTTRTGTRSSTAGRSACTRLIDDDRLDQSAGAPRVRRRIDGDRSARRRAEPLRARGLPPHASNCSRRCGTTTSSS